MSNLRIPPRKCLTPACLPCNQEAVSWSIAADGQRYSGLRSSHTSMKVCFLMQVLQLLLVSSALHDDTVYQSDCGPGPEMLVSIWEVFSHCSKHQLNHMGHCCYVWIRLWELISEGQKLLPTCPPVFSRYSS